MEEVEAQRSLNNRAKGTTELKAVNVTAEDFLKKGWALGQDQKS